MCNTDTVAAVAIVKEKDFPQLSSIILGEGVVNDAVSIILFQTVMNMRDSNNEVHINGTILVKSVLLFAYILIGSVLIGIVFGLIASLITKKMKDDDVTNRNPVSEICI